MISESSAQGRHREGPALRDARCSSASCWWRTWRRRWWRSSRSAGRRTICGGSSRSLTAQLRALQKQLAYSKQLVDKVQQARTEGDEFLDKYFMDEPDDVRHDSDGAERARPRTPGIKMGQAQFNREPIEGSDDMEVLTTNVGFEGNYANLTKFVNLLDKSPRFMIIENMQAAAPQQQGGQCAERVAEDRHVRQGEACRMTLGTGNKKQMYFLGLLIVVAAYLVYDNVLSGPSVPAQQQTAQTAGGGAVAIRHPGRAGQPLPNGQERATAARKCIGSSCRKRPEERPDPAGIDPTLFLDRLKKVQGSIWRAGSRNLFQFSAPPPRPSR